MKVQIITSLFPVPWNPNREVFNRQQFQHLSRLCHVKVLVVIPWLTAVKHRKQLVEKTDGGLRIDYVWFLFIPRLFRFMNALFLLPSLLLKYFSIRKFRPDCLLLSWAFPDAVAGAILARLLNIPFVIKVHGSDINMHCRHGLRAVQVVWAMKRANAIMSVSRDLADKLEVMGIPRSKIRVIYNGVNHECFYPMPRSDSRKRLSLASGKKILLFIGNLKREKGCLDLLEAFRTLAVNDSELSLYYIGTGKEADTIRSLAAGYGLAERVFLMGAVGHRELPLWINASDVVSLPSHNEGVPNVLLEAMACGVPVVATSVGGIPEVVPSQAGITVGSEDSSQLSEALKRALQADWNRENIVQSVKNLTWEKSAWQVYQLLKTSRDIRAEIIGTDIKQTERKG